jgi:iron complex transport system ATP-binding protein
MQINKETIEQLFRQHYLRMYQLARVLLKDDAASKDVVSEVFADVLDGKTQLGLDNETIASDSPLPSANAGSYLLVCVRHKCLNLLSRQKMKDRVHHLLKADTSPSIAPLEAMIAEIDRETDKYEAILAYMDTELTPQTRIIILDEPTAFLDFPSKIETLQMLRRLAHEQHKSILLSTHDVELALQLSDRLWLMEESRFSIGTPKELAADGSLSRFINRDGIRFNKDSLRIEIK